jgi:hypothetical protein
VFASSVEIDLVNVDVVESPSTPGVMTSPQNLTGSDTNCWNSTRTPIAAVLLEQSSAARGGRR